MNKGSGLTPFAFIAANRAELLSIMKPVFRFPLRIPKHRRCEHGLTDPMTNRQAKRMSITYKPQRPWAAPELLPPSQGPVGLEFILITVGELAKLGDQPIPTHCVGWTQQTVRQILCPV